MLIPGAGRSRRGAGTGRARSWSGRASCRPWPTPRRPWPAPRRADGYVCWGGSGGTSPSIRRRVPAGRGPARARARPVRAGRFPRILRAAAALGPARPGGDGARFPERSGSRRCPLWFFPSFAALRIEAVSQPGGRRPAGPPGP